MFNIVLLEPEKPANTGNIVRTCAVTGSKLHLIEPISFSIKDKALNRAAMDYWDGDLSTWDKAGVMTYLNYQDFIEKNPDARIFYATTKSRQTYSDVTIKDGDFIMFGSEGRGIPEEILVDNPDTCIRIPMLEDSRSLNLSNSVAIVLYEALRQNAFLNLNTTGNLHRLSWEK